MRGKNVLALALTFVVGVTFVLGDGDLDSSMDDEWEEEVPDDPENNIPKDVKVPEGVQTLTFNPAKLTEEDQHSNFMPGDLKCDGCRAIAYQATESLKKAQKRHKDRKLKESEVIDIFDNTCTGDAFEGYGIKDVEKKRRLSGDGLEAKDVPGILQGGGKWPGRLREMCLEYVGELGEDEIYKKFRKGGLKAVEDLLCRSEAFGNICPPRKMRKKKKSKEEL